MAYVIAAVIVVLVVAGFVVFMVTNAASKSGPAATGDGSPGIGPDDTPLGDTAEHADERAQSATVVGRHETDDPDDAAHRARPGEGEGGERLRFEAERPAHEREER